MEKNYPRWKIQRVPPGGYWSSLDRNPIPRDTVPTWQIVYMHDQRHEWYPKISGYFHSFEEARVLYVSYADLHARR